MARAFEFVDGLGVVPKGTVPHLNTAALPARVGELVRRYVEAGQRGDALIDLLDRHANVVRGQDPDLASEIRLSHAAIARIAYAEAS